MNDRKIDLFLDSGAFSAETQGAKIQLKDYIKFIKDNKDVIDIYANLDVIGNEERTFENQKKMEAAGLKPLPVFHAGEDLKFLKYYIANYPYICLGGMVGAGTPQLTQWLDEVFPMTCDEDGMSKVKVHGFGLTSLRLMLRYPWFSVDSTSWVITGRMGSVYVPVYRNGEWLYNEDTWKIAVSNRSTSINEAGQHITTLTPSVRKVIDKYFEEKGYKLGSSKFENRPADYQPNENERWAEKKVPKQKVRLLEIVVEPGLCNKYELRDELNIIYFRDLEAHIPPYPWKYVAKNGKTLGL